ncbi:hypothetical protein [Nonomuraea typhae]|uniref:hypothetical protein n=1 Tax=Nonomuraea typhae TaxID=2603600 RepID=UPI0012FAD62A|nr:hypothetical protein [Nonomuraea typhae]
MAPTIAQVMQGIEARLATIAGLRVDDVVPDQINPPAALVGVPPIPTYHQTMGRGRFMLEPTVTVLVSAAVDRAGQLALAGYANPTGPLSVLAAIEGDRTLGAVVEDCIVIDFRPLGLEEVGQIGYYGGVFTLRVIALGT